MLRRRAYPLIDIADSAAAAFAYLAPRRDDGEGVVIDFNRGPGTGPISGRRIESLMLRMASGVIFDVSRDGNCRAD